MVEYPFLWFQSVLLASVRLTVGLAMTPLFSAFGMPMLARLLFVLVLAGLAMQAPNAIVPAASLDMGFVLPAIGQELAMGLVLSIGVHAAFAAFSVAGRLIDTQLGFTLGAVLDPVSKGHAAVLSTGMSSLAIVLFFVGDAHQLVLTGYFRTFELLPVGQSVDWAGWLPLVQAAGGMFSIGFLIAAPVVVALWLADVVVAVVARNLPQMNLLFISIPLKVLLGLFVMTVALYFMAPVADRALTLPVQMLDKVI